MFRLPLSHLSRRGFLLAAGILSLPLLSSCGGPRVNLTYPGERMDFSAGGFKTPDLYFGLIRDLRPAEQKSGQGRFIGITFPSDDSWEVPVTLLYRDALSQDLQQTHLVELVPLAGQADYTLEADILSFSCRLQRSPLSFLLPVAVGMGAGMAWGSNSSDRAKRGAALGVVGLLTIPLPTRHRAEAEVRLRLRDGTGEVIWERACLGEVTEGTHLTATARDDQKLVDRYLTRALKKCNACLLGQLRQELVFAD